MDRQDGCSRNADVHRAARMMQPAANAIAIADIKIAFLTEAVLSRPWFIDHVDWAMFRLSAAATDWRSRRAGGRAAGAEQAVIEGAELADGIR